MRAKHAFKLMGVVMVAFLALAFSANAERQCAVAVFNPTTLHQNQTVKFCGNNFRGPDDLTVGIATYLTQDATEPIDLQFINLKSRKGFCMFPKLPRISNDEFSQFRDDAEMIKNLDVFFMVGVSTVAEEPLVPPILSAQKIINNDSGSGWIGEGWDAFFSEISDSGPKPEPV